MKLTNAPRKTGWRGEFRWPMRRVFIGENPKRIFDTLDDDDDDNDDFLFTLTVINSNALLSLYKTE